MNITTKQHSSNAVSLCITAGSLAMLGTASFAANPYPNPSGVTRFLDAPSAVTVPDVVNNGALYKRGAGTATLTAPALNDGGTLNVAEGNVILDLDATPTITTLPTYLQEKIKLWLDANVNIEADGELVTKWYDCRETAADINNGTPSKPYATSEFNWWTAAPAGDRRPSLASGGATLNGNYLDFGAYGEDTCKWLCITNTGKGYGYVSPIELFAVFARRESNPQTGFTMFSGYANSTRFPFWMGDPSNKGTLWGSSSATRADKSATRLDRGAIWGGFFKIRDYDWHVLSSRLPTHEDDNVINQIGLDRDYPRLSGGFCLAEVIMCEGRLSEFDRMRIEDYLWKKWMGARQTSVGSIAIAADSKVTATTASDVTGALSGSGEFVKIGAGTATLVDNGFAGTVELASGAIRTEGMPIAIKETGQRLGTGTQGMLTRTDDAAPGAVEKSGNGQLVAASLPAAATIQISDGRLSLAPPVSSSDFITPADFPNANFEEFGVADSENVGGGTGTTDVKIRGSWTFDRVGRTGNNLLLVLNKDAQFRQGTFKIQAEDSYGIGYEGTNYLYLCRGDATGAFTVPASGMYRLSFNVGARDPDYVCRPINIKIDGTSVRTITSFNWLSWMRYEVALPFLSAGDHTVTFSDEPHPGNGMVILFDDIKVIPVEARDAAPVAVAIANPGFEEDRAKNIADKSFDFKPKVADSTGWTMQGVNNEFAGDMVARRWFDGVTNKVTGLLAVPDEMAEGFLCAQIYGDSRPVSQTVSLPSAGRYRLTFCLAKRVCFKPQFVTVSVGGTVVKKIWVRHDDWCRYEAFYDASAAGDVLLHFAGSVATSNNQLFTTGSAWLDDIAMERISDIPSGNLVANGDFEGGSEGWTFLQAAAPASTAASWINGITNTPPMGADCAVLGGTGYAEGAIRQQVSFPSAGRYELSFRVKRYRTNPFGDDGKTSTFFVTVGDDRIWESNLLRHEEECVVRQPFAVAEAGTCQLEFHTSLQDASRGMVLVDEVSIVPATAADRTDLAQFIPASASISVASGATLNLDFDGVAKVTEVRYNGHRVHGEISHATCPAWVFGRGRLYAPPSGTTIIMR